VGDVVVRESVGRNGAAFDGGDLTAAGMGRPVKKKIQWLTGNPNWTAELGFGDVVKENVEKGVPQSLPLLLMSKEKTDSQKWVRGRGGACDISDFRYKSCANISPFGAPWVSLPKTSQSLIP
jgi:hypothetical protein